jgi:hypothetical protein
MKLKSMTGKKIIPFVQKDFKSLVDIDESTRYLLACGD